MSKSKIEWTDHTINPIVGCSKCSPGCLNCYAIKKAQRNKACGSPQYQDVVDKNGWTGKTVFHSKAFDSIPKRDSKKIFIGSMTDIFHESVPFEWLQRIWEVMQWNDQHVFQILTKRPDRMLEFLTKHVPVPAMTGYTYGEYFLPENIWLGVTVCNQKEADRNIPVLLKAPAAVRFVSIEPMLGIIDLENYLKSIQWVICGGESGPNARPLNPDDAIFLRDQCLEENVSFFFKQWGEYEYDKIHYGNIADVKTGRQRHVLASDEIIGNYVYRKAGTAKSGNKFQGIEYKQFPEVS